MNKRSRRSNRQIKNKSADVKNPENSCGADGEPTECICPKCGIKHIKHMFWTGRGIPRIYCDKCYTWMIIFNICNPDYNDVSIDYSVKTHILNSKQTAGDGISHVD